MTTFRIRRLRHDPGLRLVAPRNSPLQTPQYFESTPLFTLRCVATYARKKARSTLSFLEQVVEDTPFSIERIQTDRGQEFFAYKVAGILRDTAATHQNAVGTGSGTRCIERAVAELMNRAIAGKTVF